jgi:hypothetical protein
MKPANDNGQGAPVLDVEIDVEAIALRLGLTEDQVRKICHSNAEDILSRMNQSAEDAIREIAYNEGFIQLGSPEIPDETFRSVALFAAMET